MIFDDIDALLESSYGSSDPVSIPAEFSFTAQTDVAVDTVITSNEITVSGLASGEYVTVTVYGSGSYSRNGRANTTTPHIAYNGDVFSVQHNSGASNSAEVTTTLRIGGRSATFSTTTVATIVDSEAPSIVTFTVPSSSASLTVPITFVATDNVGITGWFFSDDIGATPVYLTSQPPTMTFSGEGVKTAYAWVKDAANNVTGPTAASSTCTINLFSTVTFDSATGSVNEGSQLVISATRTNNLYGAVVAEIEPDGFYNIATGYTLSGTTLSWADGEGGSKSVTLTATADNQTDGVMTVSLSLSIQSGVAAGGAINTMVITIADTSTGGTPNTPPVISGTPGTTARVGSRYQFVPNVDKTCTWTGTGFPLGATIDAATGTVVWTPTINDVTTASNPAKSVTLTASDGTSSDTLNWTLTTTTKYVAGHWMALRGRSLPTSDTLATGRAKVELGCNPDTNLPETTAPSNFQDYTGGIIARWDWSELEYGDTGGQYSLGRTSTGNYGDYNYEVNDGAGNSVAGETITDYLNYMAEFAPTKLLIVMIIVRGYTGDKRLSPLPSYLENDNLKFDGTTYPTTHGLNTTDVVNANIADGGYGLTAGTPYKTLARWRPEVTERMRLLLEQLGDFDTHPNFGGVAFQETPEGAGAAGRYNAGYRQSNFDGTTAGRGYDDNYEDQIKKQLEYARLYFPYSEIFQFIPQIPAETEADLKTYISVSTGNNNLQAHKIIGRVMDYCKPLRINFGNPDVLPDDPNLTNPTNGIYHYLNTYLPWQNNFTSMQRDSFNTAYTMYSLFKYARDTIKARIIFWNGYVDSSLAYSNTESRGVIGGTDAEAVAAGDDSTTWTIPGNKAPVPIPIAERATGIKGNTQISITENTDLSALTDRLRATATDADLQTLTYAATGLPTGVTMSSTGYLGGTFPIGQTSPVEFSWTVTDGIDTSTQTESFIITKVTDLVIDTFTDVSGTRIDADEVGAHVSDTDIIGEGWQDLTANYYQIHTTGDAMTVSDETASSRLNMKFPILVKQLEVTMKQAYSGSFNASYMNIVLRRVGAGNEFRFRIKSDMAAGVATNNDTWEFLYYVGNVLTTTILGPTNVTGAISGGYVTYTIVDTGSVITITNSSTADSFTINSSNFPNIATTYTTETSAGSGFGYGFVTAAKSKPIITYFKASQPETTTPVPAPGTGNYNPDYVAAAADYIYVDLNATTNGNGLTSETPTNVLPSSLANGKQLFFNADNGVQRFAAQDDGIYVDGNDIQISSYSATGAKATVSAYQVFTTGWTNTSGNVWQRTYNTGVYAAGPVVGNVIDLSDTSEWANGSVLDWTDLSTGTPLNNFVAANLALGHYAYNYNTNVMYIRLRDNGNPNTRSIGISRVGRFLVARGTPTRVAVHNLKIEGFCRAGINVVASANKWRIHHNDFYGIGGMYNEGPTTGLDQTGDWYHGTGIQMARFASDIEVDNNTITQTYDSPISPQHFGGAGNANGSMKRIYIHNNTIRYWGLAGVELAIWADNCNIEDVRIIDNVFYDGGDGFSGNGDGGTDNDAIHLRGGGTGGTFTKGSRTGVESPLVIRGNYLNGYNAGIHIGGGAVFVNPEFNKVIIDDNMIWGNQYGIQNGRGGDISCQITNNHFCSNSTAHISDNGTYSVGAVGDNGNDTGTDCAAP